MLADDSRETERAAALPTAVLSDALDSLGLLGSLRGIAPLTNRARTTGPAFTAAYEPLASGAAGGMGDFLDEVPAGGVVVIDNAGRSDCTVWGGIMTETAIVRGLAGTVIHGVCRDVNTVLEQDYPMFSVGRFMRTGKDRVHLVSVQRPLTICGVTITPGDLVRADADGVVVVPSRQLGRVLHVAERIERVEQEITAAVRTGVPLRRARAEHGYHQLQRGRE